MGIRFYFVVAKLLFIVAVPVILLMLPSTFFDEGESICVSRLIFDVECYACGLTRACMHLIHLEFEEAFMYHMGSFIALPALASFWVYWFIKELKTFVELRKKQAKMPLGI